MGMVILCSKLCLSNLKGMNQLLPNAVIIIALLILILQALCIARR